MIQAFLYAISALVTISFLTVWTIQRSRDLAILRALGASPRYLRRDAIGQAAIILAVGILGGLVLAVGLGLAIAGTVPFTLSLATVLFPALALFVLGLGGALIATRSISTINPLTAFSAA